MAAPAPNSMNSPVATFQQQVLRLMQARDWRGAAQACEQFTARHAELAAGWVASGQVALAMQDLLRARECAAAAAARADADPVLWDLIGTLYSRANDQPRALAAYDRALALAPDQPAFLFNRAAVQRFLGELAQSEADYDRVIALRPTDFEAYKNRSELRRQTSERNHVAALRRLQTQGLTDWRGAVQVHYALAKEYEDLGDYAASFEQLQNGSRLRRAHLRYDIATDLATVDWIIEAFPEAATPQLDAAVSDPASGPIFILGLPRSGSTLIERILGRHSMVHAAGELQSMALAIVEAVQQRSAATRSSATQMSRRELIEQSSQLDFDALGHDYRARARASGATGEYFIDKMPLNFLYCGLIRRALPQARIVHVQRHPMAACYAMFKTLFEDAYPFSYDLSELARYYLAYRRLMRHWRQAMPGQIYELRYESMIEDQLGETQRLLAFCGLDWEDACAQFHENPDPSTTASAAQVRQPIYDSSVEQWRHYGEQLTELRRLLLEGGIDVS
jgi:tetratricopeptide (TPR) repeat protein